MGCNGVGTIANITITDSDINIKTAETFAIPIELYGYDKPLKWTSSDTTIATVDSDGNVIGIGTRHFHCYR